MNKDEDPKGISSKENKDLSSQPRMCGTLMLWIAEEKMKKERNELSNPTNKKVTEL